MPTEIKVVSIPTDESARNLVKATWGLLLATVVLGAATFLGSWWQTRDTKRRDRDTLRREVNLGAQKVLAGTKQVEALAEDVLQARLRLWQLRHDSPLPAKAKDEVGEENFEARRGELQKMTNDAGNLVTYKFGSDPPSPLVALSDRELTYRLWELDRMLVWLDGMRDDIATELRGYEAESERLSQHITAMQAAHASRSFL